MKRCTQCGEQNLAEFSSDKSHQDGLASRCKSCKAAANSKWRAKNTEHLSEYERKRRIADPEGRRAHVDRWRSEHPDYNREYLREWRSRNPDYWIEWCYKMTPEQYAARLAAQGGVCAGCGCGPDEAGSVSGRFEPDHDHACCEKPPTCGKCVRGLLCHSCNTRDVLGCK